MNSNQIKKARLATIWFGGCSGCHMSFLDLDEELIKLADKIDLVYGPLVDCKDFPDSVDITLVEGAVASDEHLELAREVRSKSTTVVSFGDCAVTGNVTSLRNVLEVDDLLTKVYQEGPRAIQKGGEECEVLPVLLPKVLPLHQVINVDVFLPGCPPSAAAIGAAVQQLLNGKSVELPQEQRRFG